MKTFSFLVVICLAASFPLYSYADGCEYDTQCKGDRICENRKCVSPQPANQSPTSAAISSKPAEHSSGLLGIFNKPQAPATDATYFCCTISEKLGPYPNPGSDGKIFHVGDACFGTTRSARQATGHVCD